MCKKKLNIILFLLVLIIPWFHAKATPVIDTMVNVFVKNVFQPAPDTLQFDIILYRFSNRWTHFANGTFQFQFSDTTFHFDTTNVNIDFVNTSSQLILEDVKPDTLPTTGYYVTPRLFNDRFSITVNGPKKFDITAYVPSDSNFRVGTFIISSRVGALLPSQLIWKQPLDYYEACAYKLQNDSLLNQFIIYNPDDNVPIENVGTNLAHYDIQLPQYCMNIDSFAAVYAGQKRVALFWHSSCETYNSGYIITRAIKPTLPLAGVNDLVFSDTVARFKQNPELDGLGSNFNGKLYQYFYDTVEYRGVSYCYELISQDYKGKRYVWDTSCVQVPNAVISYASAYPNPFSVNTVINYTVDDDVYLSAKVYDLTGKLLKSLMEGIFEKRGNHDLNFHVPEFASQGLYDVVLIASPIDDPSVELSRAVVKIQLIR